MFERIENVRIAVIGLGYVGLPLAVEFGKVFHVIGYDVNAKRIEELQLGKDQTLEVDSIEMVDAKYLKFSNKESDLNDANFYIVTVPTPIDKFNRPDLSPLLSATKIVGKYLHKDDVVVYESTVYPGCTEEDCVPVLEAISGLRFNKDFYVGYSPERINPGDKEHRLVSIKKITSGSTCESADLIDRIYRTIILAGTVPVQSIKIAEAAKVIENTQRDLNIALMNELAVIFDLMEIDTGEVLNAASSKWNFLPFKPGLVGGHCIGVDPYYLTHKAQELGYHPEIILAGRRLNDDMAKRVASRFIKKLLNKKIDVNKSKILVMGLTFKENCPDLRNSKTFDVIEELKEYGCDVDVFDPWAANSTMPNSLHLQLKENLPVDYYDGIIITVAHKEFSEIGHLKIKQAAKNNSVIFDLKHLFNASDVDMRL